MRDGGEEAHSCALASKAPRMQVEFIPQRSINPPNLPFHFSLGVSWDSLPHKTACPRILVSESALWPNPNEDPKLM